MTSLEHKTALALLIELIKELPRSEVLKIQEVVDERLKIDIPQLSLRTLEVYNETKSSLHSVKLIKDTTGWTLKESKDFWDRLKEDIDKGISFEKIG
jgi:hypothetical protein